MMEETKLMVMELQLAILATLASPTFHLKLARGGKLGLVYFSFLRL